MKNKTVFVFTTILAFLLASTYPLSALSSEATTCAQCHTSDRILKNLYKPPKLDTAEEGEG